MTDEAYPLHRSEVTTDSVMTITAPKAKGAVTTISSSGQIVFKCAQCSYETEKRTNWYKHSKVHLDVKSHECPQCPYKSKTASNMARHLATHTDDKAHVCQVCGAKFNQKNNLKRHVKKQHETKSFSCAKCHRYYETLESLSQHMSLNHSSTLGVIEGINSAGQVLIQCADKEYVCSQCGKECQNLQELRQHSKTHLAGAELQFYCEKCCFITDCKSRLERHLMTHTQTKPFKCDLCPYSSNQKVHVKRHILAKHSKERCTAVKSSTSDISQISTVATSDQTDISELSTLAASATSDILQITTVAPSATSDISQISTVAASTPMDVEQIRPVATSPTSNFSQINTAAETATSDISQISTSATSTLSDISPLRTVTASINADISQIVDNHSILLTKNQHVPISQVTSQNEYCDQGDVGIVQDESLTAELPPNKESSSTKGINSFIKDSIILCLNNDIVSIQNISTNNQNSTSYQQRIDSYSSVVNSSCKEPVENLDSGDLCISSENILLSVSNNGSSMKQSIERRSQSDPQMVVETLTDATPSIEVMDQSKEILTLESATKNQQLVKIKSKEILQHYKKRKSHHQLTLTKQKMYKNYRQEQKQFGCNLCPMQFHKVRSLYTHIHGQHTHYSKGLNELRCVICPYKGKDKRGLHTHMRLHTYYRNIEVDSTNMIKSQFLCIDCNLVLHSKRMLINHQNVCHGALDISQAADRLHSRSIADPITMSDTATEERVHTNTSTVTTDFVNSSLSENELAVKSILNSTVMS